VRVSERLEGVGIIGIRGKRGEKGNIIASCQLPFNGSQMCTTEILQLIHGDLVGPMLVKSIGKHQYRFILVDDYSCTMWMLPLHAKSDTPMLFEKWVMLMETSTGKKVKMVMFDNVRELIAGRMKEFCDGCGMKIILSVPYSPSSNGVAEHLVGVATSGTCTMLHNVNLPPHFWAEAMTTFMYLHNCTPTTANDAKTPFEKFYNVKPNVSYICPFGCVMKVTLPVENLGKLENHAIMGYLLSYKYEGGYHVWIPNQGLKEARDVTFYKDVPPVSPEDGVMIEHQVPPPTTTWPAAPPFTQVQGYPQSVPDAPKVEHIEPPCEKLTICVPGCYHPWAPCPCSPVPLPPPPGPHDESTPISVDTNEGDNMPKYVSHIHDFPSQST